MEAFISMFYMLFFFYIVFYIGLGIVQPLLAICRLIRAKRKDSNYAIGLKRYLLTVLSYFFLWFLFAKFQAYMNETFMFFYLMIFPWVIAIRYYRFVKKWDGIHKNIKAYDQLQSLNAPHQDRMLLDTFPKKKISFSYPIPKVESTTTQSPKTIIRPLAILELTNH